VGPADRETEVSETSEPDFLLPGIRSDRIEAEIDRIAGGDRSKLVYAIEYRHEGRLFEVTVGRLRRERKVTQRKKQPGEWVPEPEIVGSPVETGATVYAIVSDAGLMHVWELPDRPSGWANPSLVGQHEITSVTRFASP
jgi:hypothetical protein